MNSQGEVVKDYLRKYQTVSSRKIAALIMRDIPGLFSSTEACRNSIRYYRGAIGDRNRNHLSSESYIPKIAMPEAEDEDYEPFILPADCYPIAVISDIHVPFHDQDALEIALERAIDIKAKTILINGDAIDFYMLSNFQKDPRKRNIRDEIDMLKLVLAVIRKAIPRANIVYKFGNHEDRYDYYIMKNAPELYHLEETHLDNVLGLSKNKITIVQNKRVIRAGHLNIIHGHEYQFSISNPVNPARGLYLRAKKSALVGHFHQSSDHTETAINGDVVTCWSVGCLCGLHPQYMPLNKWNWGFAEIHSDDGMFRVSNHRITNYRIV